MSANGMPLLLERDGDALERLPQAATASSPAMAEDYPGQPAGLTTARAGNEEPMRLATFNILHGRSPVDDRVDVDRFAAAVRSLDADVLALQEVDRNQPRSANADLTAVAAAGDGRRRAPLRRRPGRAAPGRPGWPRPGRSSPTRRRTGSRCSAGVPVLSWEVVRLGSPPTPRADVVHAGAGCPSWSATSRGSRSAARLESPPGTAHGRQHPPVVRRLVGAPPAAGR